jgi:hypothetical protein
MRARLALSRLRSRGRIRTHLARTDDAEGAFSRVLQLSRQIGFQEGIAISSAGLAAILLQRGDVAAAEPLLRADFEQGNQSTALGRVHWMRLAPRIDVTHPNFLGKASTSWRRSPQRLKWPGF